LSINSFLSGVMGHNGFFVANSDKFPVFHGKGLGFREFIVNGINVGIVDDEVYGGFVIA